MFEDEEFHLGKQGVVIIDEAQIDGNGLVHRSIFEPLGDTEAISFIRRFLAEGGQVVLGIGVLDVGQEFGPFVHQVHPSAKKITGGSHI